ncbi:hypothetical protein Hanom_Chr14g01290161 [Helianthus anomalus]
MSESYSLSSSEPLPEPSFTTATATTTTPPSAPTLQLNRSKSCYNNISEITLTKVEDLKTWLKIQTLWKSKV